MKILTILGARPQFIKAATISKAIHEINQIENQKIEEIIVHTGQHFDPNMSSVFFDEMEIPLPKYNFKLGNLSHGAMTGRIMEHAEIVIQKEKPDLVLVYGDTNSTLAGALAASKLHVPVAHVEAGLRSHNGAMPEETNRALTDRLSDLLFCPTKTSEVNLKEEGFPFSTPTRRKQEIVNVGDVMFDATLHYSKIAKRRLKLDNWSLHSQDYALCTIHRAENTNEVSRLQSILYALNEINQVLKVVLPMHPRTAGIIKEHGKTDLIKNLTVLEPLSYLEMQRLEMDAKMILTDSGGVQKEAFFHKIPCITLRDETEWTETVELGCNILVGAEKSKIVEAFENYPLRSCNYGALPYGNGDTASLCLERILACF